MEHNDVLIGRIYEAGALPERWPATLDAIAASVGAIGGNLIRSSDAGLDMISSPGIAQLTHEFDRQGWNHENSRVERLVGKASHPGFLTDMDLHTIDEIRSMPMYTEFLTPAGADAGAATVIQGGDNDGLVVAIEAFLDHAAAHRAVPLLDRLRPHLARAAVLSSEVRDAQAVTLVEAFSAIGMAIALLERRGKIVAATPDFARSFDGILLDGPGRLRLADPEADLRLGYALAQLQRERTGCSIAVRDREKLGRAVLHLLPARREARGLFNDVWAFAILARPENRMIPGADIIGALFDLTPAEACIARGIAQGTSPSELARELSISVETVRSHLKKVYAKTSTSRQSEIAALVTRLG